MKPVLFTLLLVGLGVWAFVALSHPGGDLSYSSPLFSVDVAQAKDAIKTSVESEGSGISFSLNAPDAHRTQNGTKTVYELSDKTTIEYEVLKGDKSGLKETIILKKQSAPNEYTFTFSLKGIKDFHPDPKDNSWHFFNEKGEEKFYIPSGFMVDGNGKRSDAIKTGIVKKGSEYVMKVTADKHWLADSERAYPVRIDPSVVVSGGISSTDAQFGSLQRKITYVNSNWYAFYADGGDVFYKKSSDGVTWGGAVTVVSADTNANPTVWLEGSLIYVAWLDTTNNKVEVNTINTASADAQGTLCSLSPVTGTLDDTYLLSLAVADNGTVYFAYSKSTGVSGTIKLTFSGCTPTTIASSAPIPSGVIVAWPSTNS
jgi:hypothetical protein